MEAERSPFSINMVELLVAIGTTIITWFVLRASISSFWPADFDLSMPLPDRYIAYRKELFDTWVIPIAVILAISSIFLVRGIRNQRVRYFSRLSHFVLAWPLMLFPSITLLGFFGLFCFLFGLIIPVPLFLESFQSRRWWGSIFAIVWIVGCGIVAMNYFNNIDYLFGD
jgi:hypothetical protein